ACRRASSRHIVFDRMIGSSVPQSEQISWCPVTLPFRTVLIRTITVTFGGPTRMVATITRATTPPGNSAVDGPLDDPVDNLRRRVHQRHEIVLELVCKSRIINPLDVAKRVVELVSNFG